MNVNKIHQLAYLSLILVWGTTWVAIKVSIGDTPFFGAGLRFLIAGITLVIFQFARKKSLKISSGSWPLIIALILGNFFVGYACTYTGMRFIYSNLSSLIWAIMPVTVSFFAHFMLKNERFNLPRILSLGLSVVGLFLFFDLKKGSVDAYFAFGVLITVLGVLAASFANVYYKKHVMNTHDAVVINAFSMIIASLIHFFIAFIFEDVSSFPFTSNNILAILYLAIMGSSYTFVVFFKLIRHFPVVTMSYMTFVIPIVAVMMGWFFLGEDLSAMTLVGAGFILAGVLFPSIYTRFLHQIV